MTGTAVVHSLLIQQKLTRSYLLFLIHNQHKFVTMIQQNECNGRVVSGKCLVTGVVINAYG